jgi:HK97 family phage major capsid protein
MDINDKGGYLVAPQDYVNSLLQKVDDALFLRGLATVFQLTGAHSLGYPSLDTDVADADWSGEITPAAQGTLAFGKRELVPHPLSKLVKVSRTLIRNAAKSVESIVSERLAYKLALPQEKGFLTGNGAGQPLGLFTASANGISTGRDVSTDNTGTAVTVDGLKNAKGALKRPYRKAWIYHRDLHTMISKLKDGENRYLLQDSIVANEPDALLGLPVYESEFAPNTFTSGLYVAVLGDFSFYHIAESVRMEMQRLDELYAVTNEVGYIVRGAVDGMPALEEAFVRVKLG